MKKPTLNNRAEQAEVFAASSPRQPQNPGERLAGVKSLTVNLEPGLHRKLKNYANDNGKKMREVLEDYIRSLP